MSESKRVLIDAAIGGLTAFTSNDDTRGGGIQSIHLTPKHAEATNGTILLRVPLEQTDVQDWPAGAVRGGGLNGDGILVNKEVMDAAMKARPKRGQIPILNYVHVGVNEKGGPVLTVTDLENTQSFEGAKSEVRFPDADKVIVEAKDTHMLSLSAANLKRIADYAAKFGNGIHRAPRIYVPADPADAVRFEINLEDGRVAVGVVMPVRQ